VEVLVRPEINQGLVRFGDDARTDAMVAALQAEGTSWFGAATWNDVRVMRVSVCNWRTTEDDVERSIAAVARVLASMS
jgi:hypothetical protein